MVNFTSKTHQLKRKTRHLAKGTPKAVLKFRRKRPAYRQLCLKLTA